MKRNRIAALLTSAVMTMCMGASALSGNAADAEKTVRIMPLGDSITDGFTVVGGYRVPLWYLLQDKGLTDGIDFVGPNGWYIDGVCDTDHAGYSGYSIADIPNQRQGIYNFIDWLMEEYPADVVMLQIGTNDILSSYELDTAGDRLELLIDSILTYIPEDGMLYVSTIPYMDADVTTYTNAYTAEEMDAAVDAYNADLREIVAEKAAAGKPIAQADINSVLTKSDLGDGVHPSEDGYQKMAEYWSGVLEEYLTGEISEPETDAPASETAPSASETNMPESETAPPASETDTLETETALPASETDNASESDSAGTQRPLGDVNGDLSVSVLDIVMLQKVMLGLEKFQDQESAVYADVTQDQMVDVFDLALLKRWVFQAK